MLICFKKPFLLPYGVSNWTTLPQKRNSTQPPCSQSTQETFDILRVECACMNMYAEGGHGVVYLLQSSWEDRFKLPSSPWRSQNTSTPIPLSHLHQITTTKELLICEHRRDRAFVLTKVPAFPQALLN